MVVVLRVDKEKGISFSTVRSQICLLILAGYIDLSKRRVSPEDIVKCDERYIKSKTVASILRHVASKISLTEVDVGSGETASQPPTSPVEKESKKARRARQAAGEEDAPDAELPIGGPNEEEKLEMLYDTIGWPLAKKYGHPYDAFKLALTSVIPTVSFVVISFSSKNMQRTRRGMVYACKANPTVHPFHTHRHHRATPDTPTNQAPSRYRAYLLYACWYRCN